MKFIFTKKKNSIIYTRLFIRFVFVVVVFAVFPSHSLIFFIQVWFVTKWMRTMIVKWFFFFFTSSQFCRFWVLFLWLQQMKPEKKKNNKIFQFHYQPFSFTIIFKCWMENKPEIQIIIAKNNQKVNCTTWIKFNTKISFKCECMDDRACI